jgi:hypothetical protein
MCLHSVETRTYVERSCILFRGRSLDTHVPSIKDNAAVLEL